MIKLAKLSKNIFFFLKREFLPFWFSLNSFRVKNKHPFKKKVMIREIIKTKKQQLTNAAIDRILVYIFDCV